MTPARVIVVLVVVVLLVILLLVSCGKPKDVAFPTRFAWVDVRLRPHTGVLDTRTPMTMDSVFTTLLDHKEFESIERKYPGMKTIRLLGDLPADQVRALVAHAESASVGAESTMVRGYEDPGFDRTYRVRVPEGVLADSVAASFRLHPAVENVTIEGVPVRPLAGCCPTATAVADNVSREGEEGYLQASPQGIGVLAAWSSTEDGSMSKGEGVNFVDVDVRWDKTQPDLPSFTVLSGTNDLGCISEASQRDMVKHGTATLGIVAARQDGKGCTGIAPLCTAYVAPYLDADYDVVSLPELLLKAALLPRPTVVLIEMSKTFPWSGGKSLPVEYESTTRDAIRTLFLNDLIVVEAAGNSSVDLSTLEDPTATATGVPAGPSGAFVVASASAGSTHTSLCSNYGGIVTSFAQGTGVCAPGDHEFSGTSAASAIVAGSLVAMTGYAHAHGGTLVPTRAREILLDKTLGVIAVPDANAAAGACAAATDPSLIGVMPALATMLPKCR